jgi:DNA-binding NarL/FixJ family response regulator
MVTPFNSVFPKARVVNLLDQNLAMPRKPNIILVDDHLIFRQGLASVITVENMATVIGEASDGYEFINLLANLRPDVVLMDIDMPNMNGIEATQKALKLMPDLKIIVYTMFGEDEYYYRLIELGVKGFMLKSGSISQLEDAIREVMLGKTYFSIQFQKKIAGNTSGNKEEKELKTNADQRK